MHFFFSALDSIRGIKKPINRLQTQIYIPLKTNRIWLHCGLWLCLSLSIIRTPAFAAQTFKKRSFDVQHYHAILRVDPKKKRLFGQILLRIYSPKQALAQIRFPIKHHTVLRASGPMGPLQILRDHNWIHLKVRGSLAPRVAHTIRIEYAIQAHSHLIIQKNQAYTLGKPCRWLICWPHPHSATLKLELLTPLRWSTVASGRFRGKRGLSKDIKWHAWSIRRPMDTRFFGFVTKRLRNSRYTLDGTRLYVAGRHARRSLYNPILQAARPMLSFLRYRSGTSMPPVHYRHIVSDIPHMYANNHYALHIQGKKHQPIRKRSHLRHLFMSLSYAWWGDSIRFLHPRDQWLQHGWAAFLFALYEGRTQGQRAYTSAIRRTRKQYKLQCSQAYAFRLNRPHQLQQKCGMYMGVLLFHDLYTHMKRTSFWKAIREYTRSFQGKSITSRQFRKWMQRSTSHPLQPVFKKWLDSKKTSSSATSRPVIRK